MSVGTYAHKRTPTVQPVRSPTWPASSGLDRRFAAGRDRHAGRPVLGNPVRPADVEFADDAGVRAERGQGSADRHSDAGWQRRLGEQFQADFAHVRVHTDVEAERSTDAFGASAYSVGNNVFFGRGQYAPGTARGERLLAHELVHVMQQAAAGGGPPGLAHEREADELAERVLLGERVTVTMASRAAVPQFAGPVAPALPKLTRLQKAMLQGIEDKLNFYQLSLNTVGFADEAALAKFLNSQPKVDDALNQLKVMVDKAIDRSEVRKLEQARGPGDLPPERPGPGGSVRPEPTLPDKSRLPKATTIKPGMTYGAKGGNWDGVPGNSRWYSDRPEVIAITGDKGILFAKGYARFEPWAKQKVFIEQKRDNDIDFPAANRALAKAKGWIKSDCTPNAAEAERYMKANGLTWHHVEDGKTMLAVPTILHETESTPHIGGAAAALKPPPAPSGAAEPPVPAKPAPSGAAEPPVPAKPAPSGAAEPPVLVKAPASEEVRLAPEEQVGGLGGEGSVKGAGALELARLGFKALNAIADEIQASDARAEWDRQKASVHEHLMNYPSEGALVVFSWSQAEAPWFSLNQPGRHFEDIEVFYAETYNAALGQESQQPPVGLVPYSFTRKWIAPRAPGKKPHGGAPPQAKAPNSEPEWSSYLHETLGVDPYEFALKAGYGPISMASFAKELQKAGILDSNFKPIPKGAQR